MPVVTLKFNLPDEKTELKFALEAGAMYSCLCEISAEIRNHFKYMETDDLKKANELLEQIRDEVLKTVEKVEDESV